MKREKIVVVFCVLLAAACTVFLYRKLLRETQHDVVILSSINSTMTTQGLFTPKGCFGKISSMHSVISSEESQIDVSGEIILPYLDKVTFRGVISINALKQVGASEFSAQVRDQKIVFGSIGVNPIRFTVRNGDFKKQGELPGPIMLSGSSPYSLTAPFKQTMNGTETKFTLKPADECLSVVPLEIDFPILRGDRE